MRKQKVIIGSDESPKYFWEPQLEPNSARGSSLQALSSFPREGEGGGGKGKREGKKKEEEGEGQRKGEGRRKGRAGEKGKGGEERGEKRGGRGGGRGQTDACEISQAQKHQSDAKVHRSLYQALLPSKSSAAEFFKLLDMTQVIRSTK